MRVSLHRKETCEVNTVKSEQCLQHLLALIKYRTSKRASSVQYRSKSTKDGSWFSHTEEITIKLVTLRSFGRVHLVVLRILMSMAQCRIFAIVSPSKKLPQSRRDLFQYYLISSAST